MGRVIRGSALGTDFFEATSQSLGARMSWNFCPRVKFTPELWETWRKQRQVDAQSLHLRAGIQEFRDTLENRRYIPRSLPKAVGRR